MPSTSPLADSEVPVFAALMVTEFQRVPLAPVMLASFDTATVVFTRYAVPVSVLCTVADADGVIVELVSVTTGAVVSGTAIVARPDEPPWLLYQRPPAHRRLLMSDMV